LILSRGRYILAEHKRPVHVHHGLNVIDVVAEDAQILGDVDIHTQEVLAAGGLAGHLGGVVEPVPLVLGKGSRFASAWPGL